MKTFFDLQPKFLAQNSCSVEKLCFCFFYAMYPDPGFTSMTLALNKLCYGKHILGMQQQIEKKVCSVLKLMNFLLLSTTKKLSFVFGRTFVSD